MLFPAEIRCPQCKSDRYRESRWLSREEKSRHRDMRPYRCIKCSHRFIAANHTRVEPRKLLVGGGALFGTAMLVIGYALFLGANELIDNERSATRGALVAPGTLEAAEAGDAGAQFRIGKHLSYEDAVNSEKAADALNWLKKAAGQGHTGAMIHLGRMYRTGMGALQNYDLAAEWIEKAAVAGDPEGMLELGRLYRGGVGFETDLILAYVWFNRAAAAWNTDAAHERESVSRQLTPEQLKTAQSLSPVQPEPR